MKTKRLALKDALMVVRKSLGTKSNLPVLKQIIIETDPDHEQIHITGTDLETEVTAHVPATPDPDETKQSGLIDASKLYSFVRKGSSINDPWTITWEHDDENDEKRYLRIADRFNVYSMIDMEEYPDTPDPRSNAVDSTSFNADTLYDHMEALTPLAGRDISTSYLRGVYVDPGGHLVSTNAHVMGVRTCDHTLTDSALLNIDTVDIVEYALKKGKYPEDTPVDLVVGEDGFTFSTGPMNRDVSYEVMGRMVDEDFPNYEQTIPDTKNGSLTFNRDDLMNEVEIAGQAVNEKTRRLTLDEDGRLFGEDTDNNTEYSHGFEIVAQSGEFMTVGFNADYALKVLESTSGETVRVSVCDDPRGPITFEGKDDREHQYLLMPLRRE